MISRTPSSNGGNALVIPFSNGGSSQVKSVAQARAKGLFVPYGSGGILSVHVALVELAQELILIYALSVIAGNTNSGYKIALLVLLGAGINLVISNFG